MKYKIVAPRNVGDRPRYYAVAGAEAEALCRQGPPRLHRNPFPFLLSSEGIVAIVPDEPVRKDVWYVAHPVSGDPVANCFNAIAWLRWFAENEPSRIYVAPWIPEVLAYAGVQVGADAPGGYEWALSGDEQVIAKLDGVIAVGGHVSKGMAREMKFARANQKYVTDMSEYRSPRDLPEGFFLDEAVY